MLLDLKPSAAQQLDFFDSENPKRKMLMKMIDNINDIYGKNTLYHAAEGIQREWRAKFDIRSPRYTTRWSELPVLADRTIIIR